VRALFAPIGETETQFEEDVDWEALNDEVLAAIVRTGHNAVKNIQ
jgi:hypothetical protein